MVITLASAMGVPLTKVAEEVGIHRNRLNDKVNGRIKFHEHEIVALADFFGVPIGRLFENPRELLGVGAGPAEDSATVSSAVWRFRQLRRSEGTNSSSGIPAAGKPVDFLNAA